MTKNLFKLSTSTLMLLIALTGCDSVDEGYNPKFGANEPVTFSSERIVAEYKEATLNEEATDTDHQYTFTIDLLQDAYSNGKALTEKNPDRAGVFARKMQFRSEGIDTLNIIEDGKSPFSVTGNLLHINTAMFANSISEYGTLKSITYLVDYVVDNGYEYPENSAIQETTRVLEITITGRPSEITGITAKKVDAVIGGETQSIVQALPLADFAPDYQDFTWTIADENIATVDPTTGVVTGITEGTTTLTITSNLNPTIVATWDHDSDASTPPILAIDVVVTNPPKNVASINIADHNGSAINGGRILQVPSCSGAFLTATPTAVIDESLSGTFQYTWEHTGDAVNYLTNSQRTYNENKTGTVIFTSGEYVAGATATVNASLNGATPIQTTSSELNLVENVLCINKWGWSSQFNENKTNKLKNLNGSLVSVAENEGLAGGNALQIQNTGSIGAGFRNIIWKWQDSEFSKQLINTADAVGKKIKVSLWVKVKNRNNNAPITISHYLTPFKAFTSAGSWPENRIYGPQFKKAVPFNDNEWQLVEFEHIDWSDNNIITDTYTVPNNWSSIESTGLNLIPEFQIDGLAPGDEIYINNYAITLAE